MNACRDLARDELRKAGWPAERISKIETDDSAPAIKYVPPQVQKADRLSVRQSINLLLLARTYRAAWANRDPTTLSSSTLGMGMLIASISRIRADYLLRSLCARKTNTVIAKKTDAFITKAKQLEMTIPSGRYKRTKKQVWQVTYDALPAEERIEISAFRDHFTLSKAEKTPPR